MSCTALLTDCELVGKITCDRSIVVIVEPCLFNTGGQPYPSSTAVGFVDPVNLDPSFIHGSAIEINIHWK